MTENMDDFENSTDMGVISSPIRDSLQCPFSIWSVFNIILVSVEWTLALFCVPWALWLQMSRIRATLQNELFVFNLLCMDLVSFPIIVVFFLNMFVWRSYSLQASWVLFLLYLHSHSVLQCCVCAERYLAVVHPVTFLKFKPLRYKVVCLSLVWLVALVLSTVHYVTDDNNVLLLNFLLAILFMSYFSLSILKALKCQTPGDGKANKENKGEANNFIKKRAFIIVAILQIKLLVNYFPVILIMAFKDTFAEMFYNCFIYVFAVNICCLGNFLHSVLYLQRVVRFPFI